MTNVNINAPKALSTEKLQQYHQDVKANQVKADAMGGSGELGAWLEDAVAWVAAVRSGQVADDPNIPVWQYEQWISQVQSQLYGAGAGGYGGGWDPNMGAMGAQPQVQPPQGAILGANGNFIYDGKKADIDYTGSAVQSEVESEDVRLAVNSMGADYNFSTVKDQVTGEDVLKLVIDGPMGQQTVVFNNVNDEDFHLEVYAANMESVDISGLPQEIQDKIGVSDIETLGEELATGGEATLDGQTVEPTAAKSAVDGADAGNIYEAQTVDQHFRFSPTADGEGSRNFVVGNATITVPLSSTVNVEARKGATYDEVEPHFDYDYVISVTHSDGTSDQYYVQEGFDFQINARPGNVTFYNPDTGKSVPDTDGLPEAYTADFATTASVEAGAASGSTAAGDAALNSFLSSLDGKSEDNVLNAFIQVGLLNEGDTVEDLHEFFAAGNFPPEKPNGDLMDALMILNNDLDDKWDAANPRVAHDADDVDAFMKELVDQLEVLYQGHNIDHEDGKFEFSIDGKDYKVTTYLDGEECRPTITE